MILIDIIRKAGVDFISYYGGGRVGPEGLVLLYYVKILIYIKLNKNSISEKNNAFLYGFDHVVDIIDISRVDN